MAKEDEIILPPLENWTEQTFSYGFMLDRSFSSDYSGAATPGTSDKLSIADPKANDLHILNLNPQQIQVNEPLATSISFTQGGGKVIESRGQVIKDFTIRGTTGFLPPKNAASDHIVGRGSSNLDANGGVEAPGVISLESTGFFEFYRLRGLFRKFGAQRKVGLDVSMHWLDFKGDEFWVIEPTAFSMVRTRFSYNYTITFKGIELSGKRLSFQFNEGELLNLPGRTERYGVDNATEQMRDRMEKMGSSGREFSLNMLSGIMRQKLQGVLRDLEFVQLFFADAASLRRNLADGMLGLLKQVSVSLSGLLDAIEDNTPAAFKRDLNEWAVELTMVNNHLFAGWQARYGRTIGDSFRFEDDKFTKRRAVSGTRGQVMEEVEGSGGSLAFDPGTGGAGLSLIGDIQKMIDLKSLRSEDIFTKETIFDLARRLIGDTGRFVDLVIINKLSPPYIVSSSLEKPPGTLAWGEQILVPTVDDSMLSNSSSVALEATVPAFSGTVSAVGTPTELVDADIPDSLGGQWLANTWQGFTVEMLTGAAAGDKRVVISNTEDTLVMHRAWDTSPSIGDEYVVRLEQFSIRRASTPDTEAFGIDILAVFTHDTVKRGLDVRMGPRGDLLTVQGQENFNQALTLRAQTPIGTLPLHARYGFPGVLGRRVEPNVLALHVFAARQGLLADPRVQAVNRPRFTVDGGALRFEAEVEPIRTRKPTRFRVAL